jgi:hypothetical protein
MVQHIDILPCAGLGNRMRAVASAMSAAQELMMKPSLTIYWREDGWLCAPFRSLFDMTKLPPWVQVVEIENGAPEPFQTEVNSEAKWREVLTNDEPVLRFKSWAPFYDANSETWPSTCPNPAAYRGSPAPTERWLTNLRSLQFVPEIVEAAKKNLESLDAPIGVHLRQQDHFECMRQCSADTMWATMEKEQTLSFFFTSDNMKERINAMHKFPGRVRLSSVIYNGRSSVSGMINGAIDFLTLSRCTKVLGSFRSSFSEMAAAYGGVPYVPVRNTTIHR